MSEVSDARLIARLRAERDALAARCEALERALKDIVRYPANLSDSQLEARTGPNDAVSRGIMVTAMRSIARAALAPQKQEPK